MNREMGQSCLEFETRICGKWVLAGEHSVLRGATAIALPHPKFHLRLAFHHANPLGGAHGLRVEPAKASGIVTDLLAHIKNTKHGALLNDLHGALRIESNIPIGAGLGSSAALCVAITRWLAPRLGVTESEQFDFATSLEHKFHGKSSGMDIAVTMAASPIVFNMQKGGEILGVRTMPRFTFHDTGLRSPTSECVKLVEDFRQLQPEIGSRVDGAMSEAALMARDGLLAYNAGETDKGTRMIATAMKLAQECFYSWGIVPEQVRQLESDLLKLGALATKLTGAGGGGFVVALW